MDERCLRPHFCTIKAELGRGQPGLMRLSWDEALPQCSIDRSTLHTAAHRDTSELAAAPYNIMDDVKCLSTGIKKPVRTGPLLQLSLGAIFY